MVLFICITKVDVLNETAKGILPNLVRKFPQL